MTAALPRVILLTLTTFMTALDSHAEPVHVRGLTPRAGALIGSGLTASASFRALVDRLNDSDVIVYVKDDPFLPRTLAAQLTFLSAAGDFRYLIVRLAPWHTHRQQVASLGHELQHAVEVADRRQVVSQRSLAHAFASISSAGYTAPGPHRRYETVAARLAGQRIWRDLYNHERASKSRRSRE